MEHGPLRPRLFSCRDPKLAATCLKLPQQAPATKALGGEVARESRMLGSQVAPDLVFSPAEQPPDRRLLQMVQLAADLTDLDLPLRDTSPQGGGIPWPLPLLGSRPDGQ